MARITNSIGLLIIVAIGAANGQEAPTDGDTAEYREAYELIFDSFSRAKKAEALLLLNGARSYDALTFNELCLLCRVYNELGNTNKQLEVAECLWRLDPNSIEANSWLSHSYVSALLQSIAMGKLDLPKGAVDRIGRKLTVSEVVEFADKSISTGVGIRRAMILMKANALLHQSSGITEADKRLLVTNLLVEAAAEPIVLADPLYADSFSPELLLERNLNFRDYFNQQERADILQRIRKCQASPPSSGEAGVTSDDTTKPPAD